MSPLKLDGRPRFRRRSTTDIEDYFAGPKEYDRHSKWPIFMRLHGSILPEMILPLIVVGCWSTAITVISELVTPLGISNVLLTVLGFVVGLALSFRSSTAYERYAEGRKYWGQLIQTAQTLARTIWIHVHEREETYTEDLLGKVTALNLIVAFCIALKHRLRFEPFIHYDDICGLVDHLDTFARDASDIDGGNEKRHGLLKATGQYLGVSFAESNPRKVMKKATKPLGNLPLEILSYLSIYIETSMRDEMLRTSMFQVHAANSISTFNEVLVGCERVLNTPLPTAYTIAIAQITWLYIIILPFQLVGTLNWIAIPGSLVAAYIILGLALIGREIENPFGRDVNDLPLDQFCDVLSEEIDTIMSIKMPTPNEWMKVPENKVLYPISNSSFAAWNARGEKAVREALSSKAKMGFQTKKSMQENRVDSDQTA
ncbi:UPF0187-domain-containing protein [Eremomyces bilateralis CBS 781.70]|uniref:UPF0187-domain-containing protein n=1 Tax=Eremomyces bilateralis CBS 781.70 TaxID=1392243 RepID=A0A6G1FS51_9PEZI|nr:UPF0187-domain-containing protein [Eremomyces bilateralis CBS 781.70]KAF1808685.1 UPF0187-domain-containing protein [Eremomyces bilateralis CBS 781.70]